MRTLLDTHTLLWWFTNDARLSTQAREVIGDEQGTVLLTSSPA